MFRLIGSFDSQFFFPHNATDGQSAGWFRKQNRLQNSRVFLSQNRFCRVRIKKRKRDILAQSARAPLTVLARVLLSENAGWFSLCITNVKKNVLERQLENASLSCERQERIWSTLNVCVAFLGLSEERASLLPLQVK